MTHPSTNVLWDPIFGRAGVAAATDDRAWLRTLCDVEAALARACADVGLIDTDAAGRIAQACAAEAAADPGPLGAAAAADGAPVRALVQALRERVGADIAAAVHLGATSQDILDTAAMIVARDAIAVIDSALRTATQRCAVLAAKYRDTPMVARTLLQHAVPTTFGALAAGWGDGLDRAAAGLRDLDLAVQLGGAAGTLAGWYPHGPAVRAAFAGAVHLRDPGTVWHAERTRIADLASALGVACGSVAKVATDVVLLAQAELGEVREAAGGRSSAMAHKHNPIAAVTARAAAAQAPGLVATLLAAMPAELQRGAGPWHAEWPALTALLDTTGGAAQRLADSLAGLQVDTAAMARNLRLLIGAEYPDLGHAGDIVDHYLEGRVTAVELHADVDGPVGAPTLVLLHSIGTSTALWEPQVGALAEQFRVLLFDARGHGRSPLSPPGTALSIADLGVDLLAALDRLGVGRAHVAGLSLGGMTAMWLAIHHPQRVDRLALLCTSAHPGNEQAWLQRAADVRTGGMRAVAEVVVDRWITPELKDRDPGLYADLLSLLTGTDAESYAQGCIAVGRLDLRADLPRIAAPTLVIGGAEDPALPVDHQQLIAELVPGARLEVLTPAAHLANIEQAGAITRLLLHHFGAAATSRAGFATRRAVLGDAHVDRAIAATTEQTAQFQDFLTRYAWGEVWSRPGLTRKERSIATLASLVTLGAEHELALHVRAALRNGLTREEIAEVLLHTAVYAGLPRSNRAFAVAQETFAQQASEGDG